MMKEVRVIYDLEWMTQPELELKMSGFDPMSEEN